MLWYDPVTGVEREYRKHSMSAKREMAPNQEDWETAMERYLFTIPLDGWQVYAGAFTQVLDGLENLLRMPFGCFEQTSSVTYPNVLVLQYLKRTGKAQPETEMKARHFITIGYQRLLTFEVQGGGFSWFGDPPAHKVLTAYGLLEFADMSKVHDVDPNLLVRTINWLISKQNPDGSWTPDQFGIHEGATTRQTAPHDCLHRLGNW